MSLTGNETHDPLVYGWYSNHWETPSITFLMAFSMGQHFWVWPERTGYTQDSLMHCEEEASLINVRQEASEHNNDVILTCSELTVFCGGTESYSKHKSWWLLIPSACASPHSWCFVWQALGKSNPVFSWLTEWVNCLWVLELSAFVLRMSYSFPLGCLKSSTQSHLLPLALLGPCFLWGVRRPQGAVERSVWRQLSPAVLHSQCLAEF